MLAALVSLLGSAPLQAQDPLALTLEDAIRLAQQRSPAARIAFAGLEAATWDYRAFRARFMPAIAFSGAAPGFDRNIVELQRDDGSLAYIPQSKTSSYGSLSLEQPIPLTGGSLSLQSGLSRIDQFGNDRFYQWRATPLVVQLTQPLFRFNAMKWQRDIEPLRYQAARRTFEEELTQIEVDVTDRYFAAHAADRRVQNLQFNVSFNDTTYQIARGRYVLGELAEHELLESELQLLNAQAALARSRIERERSLQALKAQLGLRYDQEIALRPPADVPNIDIDPQHAVALSRDNTAAYLEDRIALMQADRAVAEARHGSGSGADLVARFGLNQSADIFSSAYDDLRNQQSLQIGFSVPLFQWGRRRAELASALAARDETEEQLALRTTEREQEVYILALEVEQLRQQVALAARADTVASARFNAARNRYAIGRVEVRTLFDAQQARDQAQEAYYQAQHEFWRAYHNLRRLTMYDFAYDRPLQFENTSGH